MCKEWYNIRVATSFWCIPTNCTPAKAAEKANLSESSYGWYKTDATGSELTTSYSKTNTTTLSEGEYIKLYSCNTGYSLSGTLVYQCEYNSDTKTYEWQTVYGYSGGTCAINNCTPANATEKSGLSELSNKWAKTNSTGLISLSSYTKTSTTALAEETYLKLDECANSYVSGTLVYHCEYNNDTNAYEWQPVSGYSDGTCVPTNCTPVKATEKSGLSTTASVFLITNATGSTNGNFYGKTGTSAFARGTYLKLYTCISGYTVVGTLIYHCENDSSTGIDEWQPVSGYTDGTCVKDE